MRSVTNQPQANLILGSQDLNQSIHEKALLDASLENSHNHHCEHDQTSFSEHHSCHNIRLRRFLLPAIFALVAFGGLLAWSCFNGMPTWGVELMGRALDDTTSNESTFTKNKRQFSSTHTWLYILIYKKSNHLCVFLQFILLWYLLDFWWLWYLLSCWVHGVVKVSQAFRLKKNNYYFKRTHAHFFFFFFQQNRCFPKPLLLSMLSLCMLRWTG